MQDVNLTESSREQTSARWLYRRLIAVYAVGATVAVVIAVVLFLFGLDLTPQQTSIFIGAVSLGFVPMLFLDILVINFHFRPIGAFLHQLPKPELSLSNAALVRAINLPALTVLRVMLVHLPSIVVPANLFLLLANHYLDLDLQAWRFLIADSIAVVAATGHAISEYFAVAIVIRPVIHNIWRHCDGLSPVQRRQIIPVPMKRKLLLVSAFVVFIPLLILGFSVLLKVNRLLVSLGAQDVARLTAPLQVWVVLLVTCATVIMLFISIAMAREITHSVDEMVQAMRQVENEEIDTHLVATTTDEFATLFEGFNRMTRGLQERERLRYAFGRYVAPELAEKVMRHGVHLGGETINASVLFADIRGFTALSERMSPTEVVSLLNGYFLAVEPAIRVEGGWINKFGGDSLLAIFGAPVPQINHTKHAVHAALDIRARLSEFNTQQHEAGRPTLRIGIGIACGEMVAGSVGSPERMEYTVIGDVVNVASRIDTLNKMWGTDILISAEVYETVSQEVSARAMPLTEVPGKSGPIQVYALE